MNSDAHVDIAVGQHQQAEEVLREVDFPSELVANYSLELVREYLNYYRK